MGSEGGFLHSNLAGWQGKAVLLHTVTRNLFRAIRFGDVKKATADSRAVLAEPSGVILRCSEVQ